MNDIIGRLNNRISWAHTHENLTYTLRDLAIDMDALAYIKRLEAALREIKMLWFNDDTFADNAKAAHRIAHAALNLSQPGEPK